jgi:hypothetical protein
MESQSSALSKRLAQLNEDGRTLIDDSALSEENLTGAMREIVQYASEKAVAFGATVSWEKSISLYDCQVLFEKISGRHPDPKNKKIFMKPDGGILFLVKGEEKIPILISEDKVQGTNDVLFTLGKKRQATGNAIERAAKNIRFAEMLFTSDIFPYVIFASGCDFHPSETIAKRLESMNFGTPNHYVEMGENVDEQIEAILPNIDVKKRYGSVASIFVKAHKWDIMDHGTSKWKKEERIKILQTVVDNVFTYLKLDT